MSDIETIRYLREKLARIMEIADQPDAPPCPYIRHMRATAKLALRRSETDA